MRVVNLDRLIEDIYDLIYKEYGNIDTNDLNDVILELIKNNVFTSKDSIGNLITMLEDFVDYESAEVMTIDFEEV